MKYEETAKRLCNLLERKGWRAQDLADRSGVSKASISQYVNGQHKPSQYAAEKMAQVLGVEPTYLLGFDTQTLDYYKDLQRYMSKLNDKGKEQVAKYIIFVAQQEEYKDEH